MKRLKKGIVKITWNMLKNYQERSWAIEKPKLHSARKLRAISYFDPEDTEFGETVKNAHNFLEMTKESVMPCKFSCQQGKPGAHNTILENQDTLVRLKSTNLRERALERHNPEIMKISLLRRRSIQCVTVILYTRLYPYSKQ